MTHVLITGSFRYRPKPNRLANLLYECVPNAQVDLADVQDIARAVSLESTDFQTIIHNQIYSEQPDLLISTSPEHDDMMEYICSDLREDQVRRNDERRTFFLSSEMINLHNNWLYNDQIDKYAEPIDESIEILGLGGPLDTELNITWLGNDYAPVKRPELVYSYIRSSNFVIGTPDELPLLLATDVPFGVAGPSPYEELKLSEIDDISRIEESWDDISNTIDDRRTQASDLVLSGIERLYDTHGLQSKDQN